jgi:hypothetical protein
MLSITDSVSNSGNSVFLSHTKPRFLALRCFVWIPAKRIRDSKEAAREHSCEACEEFQ